MLLLRFDLQLIDYATKYSLAKAAKLIYIIINYGGIVMHVLSMFFGILIKMSWKQTGNLLLKVNKFSK